MIPVIIGVGQVKDLGKNQHESFDTVDLMAEALLRAERDVGISCLELVNFLGIENQISSAFAAWPDENPVTPYLLKKSKISPKSTLLTKEPSGNGPVFLLNHAANLIATGEADFAAIVGAEALLTAAKRAERQIHNENTKAIKNINLREMTDTLVRPIAKKYGLSTPTDVYPLYESATRAQWGQSFADAERETSFLWSGFSRVAAENEYAWVREYHDPEKILSISDKNRMISFPYRKLMVANSAVNLGAAVILTSLEKAREIGIPDKNIVYIGAGAACKEDDDFLARNSYASSAAMEVSILKSLELNELETSDLDVVELYSCFPCVVKMARRILSWPIDQYASVYGGLTFGGGPMGNCMMHAIAMMTEKMRNGEKVGLIYGNGGFATHSHSIVLTKNKPLKNPFPQNFDFQDVADSVRSQAPAFDEYYTGPGKIEAYSVPYGRDGEVMYAAIIGLTPDNRRFICRVPKDDTNSIRMLVSGLGEPIGSGGTVVQGNYGFAYWREY